MCSCGAPRESIAGKGYPDYRVKRIVDRRPGPAKYAGGRGKTAIWILLRLDTGNVNEIVDEKKWIQVRQNFITPA